MRKLVGILMGAAAVVTRKDYRVVCGTKCGANDPARMLGVVNGAMPQAKQGGV